ncbi:TA system toxin CbtA family protein [Escherichia coli]|uniref:TA system toxin CbtA family protein n=1 Tax=Escherichia coli TaxID=562 RepID=UPI003C708496
MKTVSQNTPTIYSATTPENNPPQLVASLVPDEQRISFWPQHFGLIPQWVTLEPRIFGWMDRLCEDYCGGIWNLYTLNNGGAFTRSQLINSIDILRARRATGLMTRDNYRTVNNITLGKYPEAK